MKKIITLSLLYWIIVFLLIFSLRSNTKVERHYYNGKIDSSEELYECLYKQKDMNGFFEWCCDWLQYYGYVYGFTYQEMNFVVFVIFQPAFILYFVIFTFYLYRNITKKVSL